jgi:hypothetical protein
MEYPGADLCGHCDQKQCGEYQGANQVPQIHGHGDGVATGFAERCSGDLDDPECQRDRRYLA